MEYAGAAEVRGVGFVPACHSSQGRTRPRTGRRSPCHGSSRVAVVVAAGLAGSSIPASPRGPQILLETHPGPTLEGFTVVSTCPRISLWPGGTSVGTIEPEWGGQGQAGASIAAAAKQGGRADVQPAPTFLVKFKVKMAAAQKGGEGRRRRRR